jgi:hypothetical protein
VSLCVLLRRFSDGVAVEDGNELKSFRKGKNIYDIEEGEFSDKMLNLMSVEMK